MAPLGRLLATAAGLYGAAAGEASGMALMNPIRKVVTLLQTMQKKVTEEGEAEAQLYKKFMCYCTLDKVDPASGVEGNGEEAYREEVYQHLRPANIYHHQDQTRW